MGITGLLPFLSNIHKKVHVGQYAGRCVAVDTSCWLHRGAFSCAFELATGQPTTRYVNYIAKRIKLLLYNKVYPVMVFDGCNTPSKKNTNEKRRDVRHANREKGKKLLAEGNKSGAVDMFQKAISITNDMVVEVIKECSAMNVPVIVAPYEADAQITYLVKSGVVDFAITEDSDLLPFGCQKVLFKMDEQGYGIEIDLSDLGKSTDEPRFDGWSIEKFSGPNKKTVVSESTTKAKEGSSKKKSCKVCNYAKDN
ncbi:exonuclease 1-like [Bolinopsis microptera]|uniref:exonuclease 1-like n=1 Tax=Bolinopsis microptera TaxID=2820187 RepID=UPI003079DC17